MVDFQSRDTKRGVDAPPSDDDPDADEAAAGGESTPADGSAGERDRQSRTVSGDVHRDALAYAVVTVAPDRTLDDDPAGDAVADAIAGAADAVVTRELLAPSYDSVQSSVDALVRREDVDAVVTVGGTGVEPTDVTVDAVGDLLDKHLPGFGELFRVLSHEQEGTAVVRTRATAGVVDDVPVFCLPGTPARASRGIEEIVLEEADSLVEQASTGTDDD